MIFNSSLIKTIPLRPHQIQHFPSHLVYGIHCSSCHGGLNRPNGSSSWKYLSSTSRQKPTFSRENGWPNKGRKNDKKTLQRVRTSQVNIPSTNTTLNLPQWGKKANNIAHFSIRKRTWGKTEPKTTITEALFKKDNQYKWRKHNEEDSQNHKSSRKEYLSHSLS